MWCGCAKPTHRGTQFSADCYSLGGAVGALPDPASLGARLTFSSRVSNWAARKLPVKLVRARLDRALASITFDDFAKSAWTTGGPILESFEARATYYVAGGLCGRAENGLEYFNADDLLAVHAAGHEVGGHTFSHPHVPLVSSRVLVNDADRNAEFVREVLGDVSLSSFAYPYGDVSLRTKLLFSRLFPSCRGTRLGVNARVVDLSQLKAVPLESRSWHADDIERAVAEAEAAKGWIIFFSHDVSDSPTPWGCTPAALEHALQTLQQVGMGVLPVKHALARATFR
jgi:peptidoglycan/xylan/chitin deacetylase (PgdA/CDA1 family)